HRRLISCIRSCVHMSWRPPTPAPFPYATLFRSKLVRCHILRVEGRGGLLRTLLTLALPTPPQPAFPEPPPAAAPPPGPSHTPQGLEPLRPPVPQQRRQDGGGEEDKPQQRHRHHVADPGDELVPGPHPTTILRPSVTAA